MGHRLRLTPGLRPSKREKLYRAKYSRTACNWADSPRRVRRRAWRRAAASRPRGARDASIARRRAVSQAACQLLQMSSRSAPAARASWAPWGADSLLVMPPISRSSVMITPSNPKRCAASPVRPPGTGWPGAPPTPAPPDGRS